ncbi:hypothetical protein N0V84_012556 [Fusarium piperis]|uniref:RING-type domain-containing protein n=1 Tax=Fusarium piperis TaxID=1435070 RepID=A0A9W8T8F8_9HYPO|nr:hypothetical protein N0V84_012556 [Fusarium piperis]
MGNEESLSRDLSNKLRLVEVEKNDSSTEQDRERASDEVVGDRVALEESIALPLSTSTHTNLFLKLGRKAPVPCFLSYAAQETASKKEPVVDASDDAPKPSLATVADGVASQQPRTRKISSRRKKPFKAPVLAEVRRIAAEARRRDPLSNLPVGANDRRRTVCGTTQAIGAPSRRSEPVVIHEDNQGEDLISFENTVTFCPRTQPENSSLCSMASDSTLTGMSSVHDQRPRALGPRSSLPNNPSGPVSSGPLRSALSWVNSQPPRPETNSLRSRPSGHLEPGTSSRQPQSSRLDNSLRHDPTSIRPETSVRSNGTPLRPDTSSRVPELSRLLPSETPGSSLPKTNDPLGSENSSFLAPETPSIRSQTTSARPVASSTPSETSTARPEPSRSIRPQPSSSLYCQSLGLEVADERPWARRRPNDYCPTTFPLRSETTPPDLEIDRLRCLIVSNSLHSQPSPTPRTKPFVIPRPDDNIRPCGTDSETDADKENVYCHACGNDDEESVVRCACGHYYCHECLGQIIESSVGGDSSPFPPLCCGKPVPVDVNSTILDKDVLKAFMEKKLGLPLSGRANRAARTLPPAAKGTTASHSARGFYKSLAGKTPGQ